MRFTPVQRRDAHEIADFPTAQTWPFHTEPEPDGETVRARVAAEAFDNAFWITDREAWPGPDGPYDSVGYAILRRDWRTGTTTPVDWTG
ncbi:hypothetical protein [Actinophytocola gossypii]|uniref:GNAT family N-acetyltransferase n=1 Tax=Actinophytocola gossypii TaxID=2812003 RepID=A0ABT2J5Y5_9PSEU|nr:hypothetical protein [Actinophytocola gossypii]MCT2583272.1 hypothetical protein [Actinophytocola gossypii]